MASPLQLLFCLGSSDDLSKQTGACIVQEIAYPVASDVPEVRSRKAHVPAHHGQQELGGAESSGIGQGVGADLELCRIDAQGCE